MKVRELIEKLQTCDPELEVYALDTEYRDWVVEKVVEEPADDPKWERIIPTYKKDRHVMLRDE